MDQHGLSIGDHVCLWELEYAENGKLYVKAEVIVTVRSIGDPTFAVNDTSAFMRLENEWLPVQYAKDMDLRGVFRDALAVAQEIRYAAQGQSSFKGAAIIDARPWEPDPKINVNSLKKAA